MRPAASIADFARDPVGRSITGRTFVYAWPTPDLCVTAMFGRPEPADLSALASLYALELRPPAAPHAALIDTRGVEGILPEAFGVIESYVKRHHGDLARWVTRLAIVRPTGFVGALTSGFFATVLPPYPVRTFDALDEALGWVGGEPWIGDLLRERAREALGLSELRRALRGAIEGRLPEASIDALAQDLRLTTRTLQRRLREEGTSFRQELVAVQVRVAQRRLETSDASVTAIAYEVGCSSPQRLARLFREHTGESPSAWRAAHRRS